MKPTISVRLRRLLKEALSLGALILVVFAARSSLADHYHVPSGSMRPAVENGDHIVVNKLAYGIRIPFSSWYLTEFDDPLAGDVVVLSSPEDGEVLLKRVIGLPGERIRCNDWSSRYEVFSGCWHRHGEWLRKPDYPPIVVS